MSSNRPLRCPSCSSRQPSMHPAVSGGGEVTRICPDSWHDGDPATEHARQRAAEMLAKPDEETGAERHASGRGPSWRCEDCDWPWPLAGKPPTGSECDNCGGDLVPEEG